MKKQLSIPYFKQGLKYLQKILSISLLMLCILVSPVFAQEVLVGTTASFYESLKTSPNARTTSGSKSLKVNSRESLNVTINTIKKTEHGERFIGKVDDTGLSYVIFTFSNNKLEGKVIVPGEKKCYNYYSKGNNVFVTDKDISKEFCLEYPQKAEPSAPATATAPPSGSYVYNLESLPGATAVVMLDFDGHTTPAESWWGSISALPANMTESEIEEAWNIMSEDFRPFQVNITTNESVYQAAPSNRRMRCIFTPTTDAYPGSGGVAYIGTFTNGGEITPCWVLNLGSGKVAGETGSHEVGHTMGLYHDVRDLPYGSDEEYYYGQGNWAPIMGASFYPRVSHWSIGDYQYANNQQDDITIIGTQNGFGFRADNHGNSVSTAIPLVVGSDGTIDSTQNYGIIADRADLDYFSFTTSGGTVNITVSPAPVYTNLDLLVSIVNSSGTTITSGNPSGVGAVTLSTNLTAGTYYLKVDGTGEGDPLTTGYSDYSSIGEFRVSGNLPVGYGISGPSCVTPGVPYVFTVNPQFTTGYNFVWWVTGEVNLQQDPTDPKKATITFEPTTNQTLVVNVGINYSTTPFYQTYEKTVQIGNCASRTESFAFNEGISTTEHSSASVKNIVVTDLHGREVLRGQSSDPAYFVRDNYLPSGIYLMKIKDGDNWYVKKIVR